MHHLYPTTKGDSLCPLGFHPQVRWPTRCKRCFRDYKEHCGKKKDDDASLRRDGITASTPSLSESFNIREQSRSWVSSDNLYDVKPEPELTEYKSTADLVNLDNEPSFTTINFKLPKRRNLQQDSEPNTGRGNKNSVDQNDQSECTIKGKDNNRIQIREVKSISNGPTNNDVQFLIQVKKKSNNSTSLDKSETDHPAQNNIGEYSLKKQLEDTTSELESIRTKCDRLEREKRDIILRRLPSMDSSNKSSNNETHKLQQKCNEMLQELKGSKEEKTALQIKIRKLEEELKLIPKDQGDTISVKELKSKLTAAETLCEELMDENEALKKDVHEMEEQIDEIQDNFREDQVAEYTSLKSELEQTTKNCRILSFKLRKAEKRSEQLEVEKREFEKKIKEFSDIQASSSNLEKVKRLEQELAESTNVSNKLQTELGELNKKIFELEASSTNSAEKKLSNNKISRQSLIRSGSQEESAQPPKDLPDSSEIEKDLREQLKYSEEEVQNLCKKISRIESENEMLLLQLKKMASQRSNKSSPISGTANDIVDVFGTDEELKLQLELSEQEVLPHKEKDELEKHNILQLTKSIKMSESDKTNTRLVEYEQQIKDLKLKIDEEKTKSKQKQSELTKSLKKWENESKKLKSQIDTLEETNRSLNESIKNNENIITKLEKKISSEKFRAKSLHLAEIEKLKTEIIAKNTSLADMQSTLDNSRVTEKELRDKLKQIEIQKEKSKSEFDKKCRDLETELKNERNKLDLFKKNSETRNNELKSLKLKMLNKTASTENKQQLKIKELESSNKKLTTDLTEEQQKVKNVTAKYEDLEEEYALAKAKIGVEKDAINNEIQNTRNKLNAVYAELKSVQDSFNNEREIWLSEKTKWQRKLKEKVPSENNGLDKMRFDSVIAEKQSELEKYKKENESMNYQIDYMRKENDEIRRKLDDYQKVNKVQRNISADSSAMEREIRDLNNRLNNAEKSKKSEVLQCKMRYEEQISSVNTELKIIQNQLSRFKKEKDTYKNMLQSAQKNISELKNRSKYKDDPIKYENEGSIKMDSLEVQINSLEDELSETKLEYSKLKTQLVSDKSSYEVKLLEMQTRVNELEEEKILSSGRTKIAGLRTRMELSWQKEREEQQRVLQETATLARDLRQTLFEVEKERDKERLESKRKYEQFKKASDEEQTECRRKIKDLQCDLLELRDAHAKLRTTNERFKRDKERLRRDEDMLKQRTMMRGNVGANKNVIISQHLVTLKSLASEINLLDVKTTQTKTSSTSSSKQRSSSSSLDDKTERIQSVVNSLLNITEDLNTQLKENNEESITLQRTRGSQEVFETDRYNLPFNGRGHAINASLKRRSLSLEHTIPKEQNIWHNDNRSISSLRSVSSDLDMWSHENASVDSRLSDSSVQSDLTVEKKKKKKGIIGKLKKMTKSRSIDDQDSGILGNFLSKKPSSVENVNEGKKELKDKITGIFKRAGSSSRSNSMERQKPPEVRHDSSSRQRPLMRSENP